MREAEAAYHAEREEYLAVEAEVDEDALLNELPAEILQQIAQQTGAPADWRQWPEELKAAVVRLMQQQRGS